MSQTDRFTAKIAFIAKSLKFYASKIQNPRASVNPQAKIAASDHLPATKGDKKLLRSGTNMMRREFYRMSRNLSAKFLTDAP